VETVRGNIRSMLIGNYLLFILFNLLFILYKKKKSMYKEDSFFQNQLYTRIV